MLPCGKLSRNSRTVLALTYLSHVSQLLLQWYVPFFYFVFFKLIFFSFQVKIVLCELSTGIHSACSLSDHDRLQVYVPRAEHIATQMKDIHYHGIFLTNMRKKISRVGL